jgi:hypothetical protein
MTKLKRKRRARDKKKIENQHCLHTSCMNSLAMRWLAPWRLLGAHTPPTTPSRKNRRRVNEILKITAIACAPVFDQ